jgi:signal transduction histidine kinase/DNA-binding response OmpR family regulator/ligand-binding sensor domain-containing protein
MRTVVLLFLIFPTMLYAQQGWQPLTISDGLSQGMIYDIKQDRKGFIWVATKDGLNRFDGYNFTVFTHDSYDAFSISDNNCSALLIDSQGRLWVGTLNKGLNLYDERTRRFYKLNVRDKELPNAGNYGIQLLAEDPEGNLWVGTDKKKLFKISLPPHLKSRFPDQADFTDQVQLHQFTLTDTGAEGSTRSVVFEPDGKATVGTTHGLYTVNWKKPGVVDRLAMGKGNFPFEVYISYGKRGWFAASTQEVVCGRNGTTKVLALPRNGAPGASLVAVDENTLAVATTEYLWLMTPEELFAQESLGPDNAMVAMPTHVYGVTNLLKDQTGNIWVGTSGYGLRKFNPRTKQFHNYLAGTTIGYIFQDQQGRYYARHQFAYGELIKGQNRLMPFLDEGLPEADRRQRYLMQARDGAFWVSNVNFQTHEESLFKFSSDWQLLKKYGLPVEGAFGFTGNRTLEDPAGHLWIGATNGRLLRFDPATEAFTVYSYGHLLPQSGAEIETYALYFDQAGTLWIGTQKGMVRADHPQSGPAFTLYKNSTINRQSLSHDFVLSLHDDPYQPDRYLWVGTKGGGLERLDKQTRLFRHFTEAQGLPNKVVYGILSDKFKNLWISTNRGLAQFNPRTFDFRHFTRADGLQDDEFNTDSYFKTSSGELLFGGVSGLTAFRAEEVGQLSGRVPQAHLIGLKVNNQSVVVGDSTRILSQSIENTSEIRLAHDQNLITMEFGLMDYTNPAQNRYRYRLDGIDRDWVEAGTNRFANFVGLPYGKYTLHLQGSADGQAWSETLQLRIQIMPPFYRTWWAYLLYLLGFVALGWLLYRFQTQRWRLKQEVEYEKKEAARLAELDAFKNQFFANISHEFRTPLTLILGPMEQVIEEYADDHRFPLIQRHANRLLVLINQLLDLSKLEAGQLHNEPAPGDLAAFFRLMASSFASLAHSRKLTFVFSQNEQEYWTSFDRDKLEKIVTNMLSNAFKFTPEGQEVRMEVEYPGQASVGSLLLTVKDTGIGIPSKHASRIFERFYQIRDHEGQPQDGTGIGLALVNELVKVLGGSISVESKEGEGATFSVRLPVTPSPVEHSLPIREEGISGVRSLTFTEEPGLNGRRIPENPESENILLIIDDNADIRAYVRSIFEKEYRVMEAVDGLDGLEKATEVLPDVVICDLMMPRLDGFGFCKKLKNQDATSHIPVVMLTARAGEADRLEGLELGADEYLTKPFQRAEIQARVRNLIRQRERLFRYFASESGSPKAAESEAADDETHLMNPEQMFLQRLSEEIKTHMQDPDFSVEALAVSVHLSRTQLHRKLKALTGVPATEYIRTIRLTQAAELLRDGHLSVTQVAYAVGIENLSYFSRVFRDQYGVLPSQFGKVPDSR